MPQPSVETQLAILVDRQESMCSKLDRVLDCVEGNHSDPGLRVRVDRLEQSEATRKWAVRGIAGGVLGLLAKQIHEIFTGRP